MKIFPSIIGEDHSQIVRSLLLYSEPQQQRSSVDKYLKNDILVSWMFRGLRLKKSISVFTGSVEAE